MLNLKCNQHRLTQVIPVVWLLATAAAALAISLSENQLSGENEPNFVPLFDFCVRFFLVTMTVCLDQITFLFFLTPITIVVTTVILNRMSNNSLSKYILTECCISGFLFYCCCLHLTRCTISSLARLIYKQS